jgi:hypothetical protein
MVADWVQVKICLVKEKAAPKQARLFWPESGRVKSSFN